MKAKHLLSLGALLLGVGLMTATPPPARLAAADTAALGRP